MNSPLAIAVLAFGVLGAFPPDEPASQETRPAAPQDKAPAQDPHRQAVAERGDHVMGFPHDKATHHFRLYPDGGAIEVESNAAQDIATRDEIRSHFAHIVKMFAAGNFSAPMLIHEQNPPGADVMKQLKAKIKYEFGENERGAFIRISTSDADALKAIHEFLRFQIREHMTGDPLDANARKQ